MAQIVKVLNSTQALGADASVSNGNLQIVGLTIPIRNIRGTAVVQPYVAATLQVNTVTPTSAASTLYEYVIQGLSTIDNSMKTWTAQITSASSTSATLICDQLRAKFNGFYDIPCTFGGTATMTITGIAGVPKFTSAQGGNSVGVLLTAVTTPAVIGYGAGTLIAAGNILPVASDTQIVTTNNYTTVTINYLNTSAVETRNATHEALNQLVLYVNQGDVDYTSLVGTYGTLTQASQGWTATWTAAGTVPTMSNGVITLGGADIFYGNSDTNIGLVADDVIFITRTTATAYSTYYKLASILTGTTANTPDIPNDLAAAAENAWYIHLVRAV